MDVIKVSINVNVCMETCSTGSPHVSTLPVLEYLDLSWNNLYSIQNHTFYNINHLKILYLNNTLLQTIQNGAFADLQNLEVLGLAGTRVSDLSNPDFLTANLKNLRSLSFANSSIKLNQLQMVTEKGLGSLKNLQDLNLEYNTLNCACNLEWLIKWVSENQTQVVFHNLANYFCAYPRSDRRITILNYDLEAEKCHSQLRYYAAILSSVFILVYMMAIFVMYRNRYYIEYGWYLLRSKAKGRPKAPLGKRKIYHAFISYNGRDSKWVTRRLVPKLEQEEPRLKLCIHERDFTGGVSIVENIITNIQKSRKVVCLVTRNFLKSGWCREEFHLAQMGLFEDGNDVLILVLLDNIPEHYLSTYVRLRKLMCRKTYIEWPTDPKEEPLFWRRLREALETSNVPKQQRRTAAYGAIVMEDEELESLL
ncbi:PREDICTED: toll-like receptor 6 [Branchiostoma belcheri]|uniref:Toll-like receptor 6 n=1 Tax=Branchiostoma belcheri TaxID=7741 RepID=A0A6P4Y2T2_BRABE|nr:PREDICTED: toll-like receptor 6 [Branchiostoma belcheri]